MSLSEDVGYWELFFSITRDHLPELPSSFSADFKGFLSECLKKNASERTSVSDLLNHPFVTRYRSFDICKSLHNLIVITEKKDKEDMAIALDESVISPFPDEGGDDPLGIREIRVESDPFLSAEQTNNDFYSFEGSMKGNDVLSEDKELVTYLQ